jgi:radical SAM superfamily enzyme YgiQ (UPF0313 family)
MPAIVLATINARYAHAALGLRYLAANMGEMQADTAIVEFVLGMRAADMVEALLTRKPRIVGLGVYIWNAEESTKLVALLKRVAPDVVVVIGGPEVSYETEEQRICTLADYVITGWGDITFAWLCHNVLAGTSPQEKVIAGEQPELSQVELPYGLYSDDDVARRFLTWSLARLSVQVRVLPFRPGQDRLAVRSGSFPGRTCPSVRTRRPPLPLCRSHLQP